MAQKTKDSVLLHQIKAGISGRKRGHAYELELTSKINRLPMPYYITEKRDEVVYCGEVEKILIDKALEHLGWSFCEEIRAYATGKLATCEEAHDKIMIEGIATASTKSDVVLVLSCSNEKKIIGVSVKQCNTRRPTNAQVFFSTATAFYNLVTNQGMRLSEKALMAMKQFCGDIGSRPMDNFDCSGRISTPERYFWEEIDPEGKTEWEKLFTYYQDEVTQLLLQKAYPNDPFPPEILLHKTKMSTLNDHQEIAIFTIPQFITLSKRYSAFGYNYYRVKKGRYKEPEHIMHQAPRFGVIQMQRGGQKQHPTQLQFNLKSSYFYEFVKM